MSTPLSRAKAPDVSVAVGHRQATPLFTPLARFRLTILETLVHSDRSVMPSHHTITVEVPDSLPITVVNIEDLPNDWRDNPAPAALKGFGKSWIEAAETAILQVPSAIVPQEANYLLNPFHAGFEEMVIHDAELFEIDRRLIETKKGG